MSFSIKSSEAGKLRAFAVQLMAKESWYERQQFEELVVFRYDDLLFGMLDAMRNTDFIYEFDWMGFGKQAEQLVAKPELLAVADLETLRKLFTAHSRNESLNDGHLADMIDEGHLKLAVKRLTALL
jgi:hypothetical protein